MIPRIRAHFSQRCSPRCSAKLSAIICSPTFIAKNVNEMSPATFFVIIAVMISQMIPPVINATRNNNTG